MKKLLIILSLLFLHVYGVKAQTVTRTFNHTKSIQEFTVPDGVWEIELIANGAGGGNAGSGTRAGGKGAQVYGMFGVTPGDKFYLLVGEKGGDVSAPASDPNRGGGGGGGATFVLKADPAGPDQLPDGTRVRLVMVAGGGGGGHIGSSNPHDATDATTGESTSNTIGDLSGGDSGAGGEGWYAGGGGGYYGDGISLTSEGITAGSNGKSFFNGGGGGSPTETSYGGFGGGGAGYAGPGGGAGGGGGYSGGAASVGQRGGGGGSFIDESLVLPGSDFWIDPVYNRFDGAVQIIYTIAVLPLKLQSFSAQLHESDVAIKWVTAMERNTSYFDVERSTDGKYFTNIGRVAAAGFSNSTKTYSYKDSRPSSQVNHYRLKMVDVDGKTAYSKIVVIRTETTVKGLQVFPNPVYTDLQLQTVLNGNLRVAIYDGKGSLVKELSVKANGATTSLPVDVADLNKGFYYIKVYGEAGVQTTTFLKK